MADKLFGLRHINTKFVLLRKLIYILPLLLLSAICTYAQSNRVPEFGNGTATVKMVKYYPNPAVTVINFEFLKGYDKSYNFQIFNFIGKRVFELQNVNPKNTINLNDFSRGIYIYQLRDKSGKVLEAGKFQVSK
jgi:Secretion system C-terminal sorting domain